MCSTGSYPKSNIVAQGVTEITKATEAQAEATNRVMQGMEQTNTLSRENPAAHGRYGSACRGDECIDRGDRECFGGTLPYGRTSEVRDREVQR